MAEVAFTKPDRAPYYQTYLWSGVTEADTCKPIKVERAMYAYSMQVGGTLGGATVALHGSLDGSNFVALNDQNGDPIGLDAAGIASGLDLVLWIKPVATGGSSQSMTVTIMTSFQQ